MAFQPRHELIGDNHEKFIRFFTEEIKRFKGIVCRGHIVAKMDKQLMEAPQVRRVVIYGGC
jgi:hypothetical protein